MVESTELIEGDTYLPAAAATGVWLATGILLDVYLITTRRKRLISDVFRTRLGKTVLVVFCLHIVDRLGRVDPFKLAGAMIAARMVVTEAGAIVTELTDVTSDR